MKTRLEGFDQLTFDMGRRRFRHVVEKMRRHIEPIQAFPQRCGDDDIGRLSKSVIDVAHSASGPIGSMIDRTDDADQRIASLEAIDDEATKSPQTEEDDPSWFRR